MRKWMRTFATAAAVVCLLLGTLGTVLHEREEVRQGKAHEKLVEEVTQLPETEAQREEPKETMQKEKTQAAWNETEAYVPAVNFTALHTENPDVVAWIQIPGTQINYPVVQGTDNEYYLHRDLNGQKSSAGTIFLDYADQPDFSSQHNILYGHHMKNGSMFKDISRYKDQDYFDRHSAIILYTPEREIHLKALAAVCTSPDAIRRKTVFTSGQEFLAYIRQMTANASASAPVPGTVARLYSFVTCSYEFENARTILYAYEEADGAHPFSQVLQADGDADE